MGSITSLGDGIARIHGVDNAMAGEMLEFLGGVYGIALNLEEDSVGAVLLGDAPEGDRMGHVRLKRGHQVLLGAGNAYRFTATRLGVLMQQTVLGDLSVQKWREICFT